jgi:hypothetical protein
MRLDIEEHSALVENLNFSQEARNLKNRYTFRNDTEGIEDIVGNNLGGGRDPSRRFIKAIQCIISRNHTAIFQARTYGALVEVMAIGARVIL